MSPLKPNRPLPDKDEQARIVAASGWHVRLGQEAVDPEEMAAWLTWYEADERNKAAFDEMHLLLRAAPRLTEGTNAIPASLWREDASSAAVRPAARRRSRQIMAMAAALVLGIGITLLASKALAPTEVTTIVVEGPQDYGVPKPGPTVAASAEAVSESEVPQRVKEAYLPDGSRVALAEKSRVSVKYSARQRMLEMDKGVAYFTVAHNQERPFIVRAGDFYVRAVGTAFNVRSTGNRVVVTVSEGKVDVYPVHQSDDGDVPATGAVRAEAGKEVVWSDVAGEPQILKADIRHALSWQKGVLDFLNEPLGSAIEDINRYSPHKIVIRDPEVSNIRFSGTVFIDSTDVWIKALPGLFPITLSRDESGDYVLSLRKS